MQTRSNNAQHSIGGWLTAAFALVCIVGLAASLMLVGRNHAAFHVLSAEHATKVADDWFKPDGNTKRFEPINLPYFLGDGFFRVEIESNQRTLDLDLWVEDCAMGAWLDGKPVYERTEECMRCSVFYASADRRCPLTPLHLKLDGSGRHLLAVQTNNKKSPESATQRDTKLFWVQHDDNAFWPRAMALLCGTLLLGLAWARTRHGRATAFLESGLSFVRSHHRFLLLAALAVTFRISVAPGRITTDVSESAMIYAENLVQRPDLHFTQLDPQYRSAKYDGESHMHKPPGTYYQYAIPRVLFGFSDIYHRYLTRLPAIVGDVLIAWVLMTAIAALSTVELGMAAAAFFLLSAGVFATDGILARPDSLAIAFLMFALQQPNTRRFSLWLGTAVAFKHLALLVVPWFLFQRQSFQRLLLAGGVTLALCAPYLLDDPVFFLERLTMPQVEKGISGLAWIQNLSAIGWSSGSVAWLGRLLTLGFMAALFVLPWVVRPTPWVAGAITFSLFLVCAKNVHEHYVLWAVPLLLVAYAQTRRLSVLVAALTGCLGMAFLHERGQEVSSEVTGLWSGLLALTHVIAAAQLLLHTHRHRADASPNGAQTSTTNGT